MLLQSHPVPVHLTYCLNIHPGESLAEVRTAIATHSTALRRRLGVTAPFGLGLRLGARAVADLGRGRRLQELRRLLAGEGFYTFTVNGFPFGAFHGTRVKRQVYAPDWQDPRRLRYTVAAARILAALLPEGGTGSISTVPGSYRTWVRTGAAYGRVLTGIGRAALALAALRRETGQTICLALEPEPDCLWQCTGDMLALFTSLRTPQVVDGLAHACRTRPETLAAALAAHLGVCVDTCHAAVQFESAAASLGALRRHGVPVAKVQISAALAGTTGPAIVPWLARLRDRVYLHQTRVRRVDGTVQAYPDLPTPRRLAVLARDGELRTHYHVPLTVRRWGPLHATSDDLGARFFAALRAGATPHVELETYTFSVLPAGLRARGVVENLAGEYGWFLARWRRAAR